MDKKILVIEDDAATREMITGALRDEGYSVVGYADKNSVKGVIINRPDLVLLDNQLNDGFGHELCTEIKLNQLTANTQVILMSGFQGLEQLAKQCHADNFLSKPFDLKDLLDMVSLQIAKQE